MAAQIPTPQPLSLKGNVVKNLETFIQEFTLYTTVCGFDAKSQKEKGSLLPLVMGPDAREVYNGLSWGENEDKTLLDNILKKMKEYLTPKANLIFERHLFHSRIQKPGEKFESFYTELSNMIKKCSYGTLQNDLLRDRIVCGVSDDGLRRRMLRDPELTLEGALNMCRASEVTEEQMKSISVNTSADSSSVQRVMSKRPKQKKGTPDTPQQGQGGRKPWKPKQVPPKAGDKCTYCGGKPHDRQLCPAKDWICQKCSKRGHFQSVCLSSKRQTYTGPKKVNSVQEEDDAFIGSVVAEVKSKNSTEWTVDIKIAGKVINCRADSGADLL